MPLSISTSLILIFCLIGVTSSAFCSARCNRGWNGTNLTDQCTDNTDSTCTGCDTTFFKWNADDAKCDVNTTIYRLQKTLLNDAAQLAAWIGSTGISTTLYHDGFYDYPFITMSGGCNMTFTTTVTRNHSSIRLRMFLYVPVMSSIGNLTIVVNGINTTHTLNKNFTPYLSPTDDYYLYNTPDIPHHGTSVTISFFLDSITVGGGSYNLGLKQLMVFSNLCPDNCVDCYSNNSEVFCNVCAANHLHYKGRCYNECPAGTYGSQTQCLACDPTCATCNSIFKCTSCSQKFSTPKYLLKNGSCLTSCPQKTFEVKGSFVCSDCAVGCKTCNGDQASDCTECGVDDKGSFYLLLANGEGCQLDCPAGQVWIQGAYLDVCSYCNQDCKTCNVFASNCTSCHTDPTKSVKSILFNNTCNLDCPTNYEVFNLTSCLCPSVGYIEVSLGNCAACDRSCRTCFGASINECLTCNQGYYLVVNTSICQAVCPTGQFISKYTNECYSCSKQCIACNETALNCTVCSNKTFLFNFTCLTICPDGYQGLKFPNVCRRCNLGTYSFNNTCVNICPPLHKIDEDLNACVEFVAFQDPTLLDFSILPSFINNGAQLCLQLIFKTKLMLIHNADTKVSVFISTSRSKRLLALNSQILNITNIDIDQSMLNLKIYTQVPTAFRSSTQNSLDQLIINFKDGALQSQNGTLMTQYKSIPTNNPSFVREIFNNFYYSDLNGIGIFFSVIGILLVPFAYFKKFTYYPIIQFMLQLQLMRLIGFTLYPVKYDIFKFLEGFDVAQFQWMPNIANIATMNTFTQNSFAAYQFKSSTMNFLSLSASTLLFFCIFQPILGYLYLYDKNKYQKFIFWAEKTLLYICSTNILFASISSFVSLFINTQNLSVFFVVSQLLGLIALGLLIYFFIMQRKQFRKYKMFFLISLAFCALVPFFSKSFPVCFVLLNIAQVAILILTYKNRKKSDKRTKPLLWGRLGFLIMFNFVEIGYYSELVIAAGSLYFGAQLGIIIYIIYLSFNQKKHQQKKPILKNIQIKDQVKPSYIEEEKVHVGDHPKEKIITFQEDKVQDLMYYQQERSEKSPRKKVEGRKDSMTYYSPRKNWRNYNKDKSKTIYKEEESIIHHESDRSKVSGTHLSIKPFGNEDNLGRN